ncbi:hypothetical protein GOP47_0028132 [Adiantum capillus-veneris]|nr:hypothetical protein GOP47_0028132 [Adiantum capillus-veneris]
MSTTQAHARAIIIFTTIKSDTMSDQGHRVKLTFIKTLLRTTGLSGEALTEAMSDYMEIDDASLDSSIEFLGQFSLPVRPGEGTSSQQHAGVETSSHADETIAHRTPIPGTSHHESQRLTPNVPPSTQLTPDSQASGRQSWRHHRQSSTPQGRSTRETPPQPPAPPSVPPPPPMRTCIGSLGVTCNILLDGAILKLGAGIALKRRMGDLCSSYLKQVHIPWDDQHEDDKKYVLNTLETEYGTGWSPKWMVKQMCKLMGHRRETARRYCMVSSNKRKATICMETWQFFRKEMCLRINFPQQKEAARKRVALRHTSRLGRMGRDGFVATFTKDYGRAPMAQEIEYATYCGYRALCQTLTDTPDPLEQHGEADMTEVA